MSPPRPGGPPTPPKKALADAYEAVMQAEREKRAAGPGAPRPARRSPVVILGLLLLVGLGSWIFVTRPPWLFPRAVAWTTGEREAASRLRLYMTARRLEAYRLARKSLPASLAAVDSLATDIDYRVLNDSVFELGAVIDGKRLVLRSTDSVDAFVGSSLVTLRARSRR